MKMKFILTRRILLLSLVAVFSTFAADDEEIKEMDLIDQLVMKDGVVFSEIEDNGRKRWEVRGSSAEALDLEHIRIYNVNATFLTDDGRKITLLSNYADVNRVTMEIKTDQYVTIISGENVMTGTGMVIDTAKKKMFSILKDVQILTSRKKEEMNIGNLKKTL
jgi:LPS export ABC transporter protein LptC